MRVENIFVAYVFDVIGLCRTNTLPKWLSLLEFVCPHRVKALPQNKLLIYCLKMSYLRMLDISKKSMCFEPIHWLAISQGWRLLAAVVYCFIYVTSP